MSTVIVPSLTNQMVLAYFESLVHSELLKLRKGSQDFQSGIQEGIIRGLSIQFGKSSESVSMIKEIKTWSQIAEKIVQDKLSTWITEVTNNISFDNDTLEADIKKAVTEYAISHPQNMIDALKRLK